MALPEDYGWVAGDISTAFEPDGYVTLDTLYTQTTFNTLCDAEYAYVQSDYGMTPNAHLQTYMKEYLWDWYSDNYVAFVGDTNDIIKAKFEKRFKMAYADHWRWLQADWDLYETAYANYSNLIKMGSANRTIGTTGSDNRTVNLSNNVTSSNFHKAADTPTAIEAASDFVDNYTNLQSKDTNSANSANTGTDNVAHTNNTTDNLDSTASVEAALRTLNMAKKHTADDITELFGNCFITVYEV